MQASPVNVRQIRQWTDRDPVLSRVRRLVQEGWKSTEDVLLRPYQSKREELSIQDSCVLWEVASSFHKLDETESWIYYKMVTREPHV